ncbi:GAD-like domain-containing protein [Mesorhizobium japonicum]|uniref:GAD-like domain-containing protein n=1 Tax=Mesorhizobium japonicum TaxID=2066070 RepID=UPI003B5A650C
MSFAPFQDFIPVAAVPTEIVERYTGIVEPAVIEMWNTHGYGIAANGFLKVIDPDRYRTMIGEFLPRPDMIPVLATGMGDLVVAFDDKYRILQFRYARATGLGSSVSMIGIKAAQDSWLEDMFSVTPYAEAAATYGPLTSPDDLDYIYAYALPLPAGGTESVDKLSRARIFEHIAITAHLAGPIPFAG